MDWEWTVVQALAAMSLLLTMEGVRRHRSAGPAATMVVRALQGLIVAFVVIDTIERHTEFPVWNTLGWMHAGLNAELVNLGGTPVTPMAVVTVLAVFLGSWWASKWAGQVTASVLTKRKIGDAGTVGALSRLCQYVVMGVGVAVGLNTLGLNLSALFAASAVFAVGIGLAMQQVAENFVSGVILLVERTIRPGDVLEVSGDLVRVQHIGIRSTVARTLDDEEIILPNSKLVQNDVKNLNLSDSLLRVRVAVGVAYESDLRATMAALQRAAASMPAVENRPVSVALTSFGSSSVDFEVSVWTTNPWAKQRVVSELSLAIWDALAEAEIVIAFPQLDVHFDAPVTGALERVA